MSAATDFTEEQALKYFLTTNTLGTRPTAWYVGLFTTATTDGGGGTEVSTVGTGYSRQQVTFAVTDTGSGTWTATSQATLVFPAGGNAATSNWGTITHLAIFTAATGGTMLFHGSVTQSKLIEAGDIFQITGGNLKVTLA